MQRPMKRFCLSAAALLMLAGCQSKQEQPTAPAAAPTPPAATQPAPTPSPSPAAPAPANPPASPAANTSEATQAATAVKQAVQTQAPAASSVATEAARQEAKAAEAAAKQQAAATAQLAAAARQTTPAPASAAPKPAAAPTPPPAPVAVAKATVAANVATAIGDATKGKQLARKCAACHNFTAKRKVGPGWGKGNTGAGNQPGIFGREAGTSPGFRYKFTDYIKPGKAWHWDAAHLAAWMCDSAKAVKQFTGDASATTRMPPQHVCDKAKQDEIIAFMKTL